MANLTAKELSALEDQLSMEQLLVAGMATDQEIKTKCEQIANKHQEHFNRLMSHLN